MEIESYIEKQAITSHSHPTVVNDKNGVLSRFQVFMIKHFVSINYYFIFFGFLELLIKHFLLAFLITFA